MFFILSFLLLVQQPVIPYKPATEFEIDVDLQFRTRNAPPSVGTEVPVNDSKVKTNQFDGAPHSYIFLNVKMKSLSDKEVRCVVKDVQSTIHFSKKVKVGSVIKLEVGFVDDVKEKLKNCLYDIVLYGPDKTPTSHIRVSIDSEGLYLVNGEKSGKF